MNRIRPAALVLLLIAAMNAPAHAQGGINLSWDDCGTFGAFQRNFACDANIGSSVMVASVWLGQSLPQLNGMSSTVALQTNQASLSSWWLMQPGGCRSGALTARFNFLSGPFNCVDVWAGQASGGLTYAPGHYGPNFARIRLYATVPRTIASPQEEEFYAYSLAIDRSRSVGAGSCAGCTDGACIVLLSIQLTQPAGVGDYNIASPVTRSFLQWQPGGNVDGRCPPMDTPVRTPTWGSIKSLYR